MAGGLRALLAARRLRVRLVVIARDGSVHYAGSFSKVLSPALRLGYLVVPDGLVDIFSAVKSIVNRYPPLFESAVLCDFISEGHFGRHLRRMREVYAARHAIWR